MSYALMLLLSGDSAKDVKRLWQILSAKNISDSMAKGVYEPHVSLIGFEELTDLNLCRQGLSKIAQQTDPVLLHFAGLGAFLKPAGVLYLAAAKSRQLISLHSQVEESAAHWAINSSPLYATDVWMPHCTLGCSLSTDALLCAISALAHESAAFETKSFSMVLVEVPSGRKVEEFSFL